MVKREVPWSEKRKFALWATEGTLEKTKAWYKKDNCFSRSEFIEKAIDFYVGYLSSEENESYLPNIGHLDLERDHSGERQQTKPDAVQARGGDIDDDEPDGGDAGHR